MRKYRLLTIREEGGSAPVEFAAALSLLLALVLGVLQVAMVMIAQSHVRHVAHEAAHLAALDGEAARPADFVSDELRSSLRDLQVSVHVDVDGSLKTTRVDVSGDIGLVGPIPGSIAIRARGTSTRFDR